MKKSDEVENLIAIMAKLPGFGPRSARRIIFHLLKNKDEFITPLIEELIQVKENIITCKICGNLDFEETCTICMDQNRNNFD